MSTIEEETVAALHTLFTNVATSQQISIRDILIPDVYRRYEHTLQEAYDAMTKVENSIMSLGMKLMYQHLCR